ncbi:MAG: thiamine phosphate synthase [Phycisphaerales bacterium]
MTHPLRIIDANANRAREALRVMEDAARFVLDHQPLCARLKALRHELALALACIPGVQDGAALAWRDTHADVGTGVRGANEYERQGVRSVVVAAGKRLTEALRSIEEYAKCIEVQRLSEPFLSNPLHGENHPERIGTRPGEPCHQSSAATLIEALRYRAYDAERDLVLALGAGSMPTVPRLCVVLTESLCSHHTWLEVARRAVEGGAGMIQLREKSLDSRELLARALALVEMCRAATAHTSGGVAVIINDRPDIALLSGADGVHLGQSDLRVREARKVLGTDRLVGVSTENLEQAHAARHEGADYCGVGPMFPTTTKQKPRLAGTAYLREYLEVNPPMVPCLAIGGVSGRTIPELMEAANFTGPAGRWGVAVSSAVCSSEDPGRVCRGILAGLNAPAEAQRRPSS